MIMPPRRKRDVSDAIYDPSFDVPLELLAQPIPKIPQTQEIPQPLVVHHPIVHHGVPAQHSDFPYGNTPAQSR